MHHAEAAVLCVLFSFAAQESITEMLQAATGKRQLPGYLLQNLGAEKPHITSTCLPGDPHAVGIVRPLKSALSSREEHKSPQGDLLLVAPGGFTPEQQ